MISGQRQASMKNPALVVFDYASEPRQNSWDEWVAFDFHGMASATTVARSPLVVQFTVRVLSAGHEQGRVNFQFKPGKERDYFCRTIRASL
jgi:hypothetical protein